MDNLWDSIEEVAPDEWDLALLREISENPDCKEFYSSEECMNELGIDWKEGD